MSITSILLFVLGLLAFYGLGMVTRKFLNKDVRDGLGAVEGSLLALFAFFLGFTFSISASKLESIRQASVDEANTIGTALLRTDLYGDSVQQNFKPLFSSYVDTRVVYFDADNTEEENDQLYQESLKKGNLIWEYVVNLNKHEKYSVETKLMVPAVNEMLDAVSTRNADINARLPQSIIFTLIALSFCSCFIIGFSSGRKSYHFLIDLIYILIIALTVNLILDASNPRSGFITTTKSNQMILDLQEQLKN